MANENSEIRYLNPPTVEVRKKKYCRFKKAGIKYVDYKDPEFLKKFLNEQGKILPRRITGTSLKFQRKVKKDVANLGYAGEIVKVKAGYAMNYLVPQGFATVATESVKKQHAETLRQRAHKEAKLVADAEALAATINAQVLEVSAKVGETGKLYGSITTEQLAAALAAKGLNIEKKDITILAEEVKELGEYEAVVKLYKGIKGTFKFNVVAE